MIHSGECETATQIHQNLRSCSLPEMSVDTVRRILYLHGYAAYIKRKKPMLAEKHRQQRLAWDKAHGHWTHSHWEKVLWSDETKIGRLSDGGSVWHWRKLDKQW